MTKELLLKQLNDHARMAIDRLNKELRITATSLVPVEIWAKLQELEEERNALERHVGEVRGLLIESPAGSLKGRYSTDTDYILRSWSNGRAATFKEIALGDIMHRLQYAESYMNAKHEIEKKFDFAMTKVRRTQSPKKLQEYAIEMGLMDADDAEGVVKDSGIDVAYIRTEVVKAKALITGAVAHHE